MIGFWKRSQKKRVSSATSREAGGAVGITLMCWAGIEPCERSSYATRRFPAQARHVHTSHQIHMSHLQPSYKSVVRAKNSLLAIQSRP
jgi:hypothetical protein